MDLSQIRELLKIVSESGVAEVEIEEDDFKLVIRRNTPQRLNTASSLLPGTAYLPGTACHNALLSAGLPCDAAPIGTTASTHNATAATCDATAGAGAANSGRARCSSTIYSPSSRPTGTKQPTFNQGSDSRYFLQRPVSRF